MRWVKCVGANGDAPGPSARFGHTATCVKSSRLVVVFGGLARGDGDSKGALDDVVAYDVRADAWFRPNITTPGPRARAFHSACAFRDSSVVIACGRDGREQFGDVWVLDCDSWTWTQQRAASVASRDFASIVAIDADPVVMFGGFDGKGWLADVHTLRDASSEANAMWVCERVAPARVEVFDELATSGARIAMETIGAVTSGGRTSPEARSGHAMVLYGPNVLIHGGQGANGAAFSDTWCLRRDGDGWRWVKLVLRGHAPAARAGHAMGVLTMSPHVANVVIAGGVGEDGWLAKKRVYFDDAYFLDGENARWERAAFTGEGTGPGPRAYHTLTMVGKSKCLSFGGFNGAKACDDAWWLCSDVDVTPSIDADADATVAKASSRELIDDLRARIKLTDTVDAFEGNDEAFRQHIAACDLEDVRIGDVPKIMREYVVATNALGLPIRDGDDDHESAVKSGQGRYRHCDPATMKLKDVGEALTELQGAFIANA